MAFVPAVNVLKLEIRGTLFGNEWENVLYFSREATITPTQVEDLFDYFEDTWIPARLTGWSISLSVDELYATDMSASDAPTYTRVISPALTGGATMSAALPANVAFVMSFRTNARGRTARGRNYLCGMTEDMVTGNLMSSTVANGQVAIYEELLVGGALPTGWTWIMVSFRVNGAPRVAGLPRVITNVLYTDLQVDTQRKRLD